MKTLIIKAHPSFYGFTHRISTEYTKGAEESGKKVEIIDLYEQENKQEFFHFQSLKDIPQDDRRSYMQEKISWADELVFVFPMWWWGAPAIMKNFIDTNFLSGFAYRFQENGIPLRLLKGKTAKIFMTCDGPWLYYLAFGFPFRKVWKWGIFFTSGIKLKKFVLFATMRKKNEKQKEKMLVRVRKLSRK